MDPGAAAARIWRCTNLVCCYADMFVGGSMAYRFGLTVAMLAAALAAAPAKAQVSADPSGTWLTQAGDARVRVSKCGGGICGVVVWLREPINPATGKPQVDDKNPNPALARRPMIGLPLFSGSPIIGRLAK